MHFHEESRTSVKQSFLIAIKFYLTSYIFEYLLFLYQSPETAILDTDCGHCLIFLGSTNKIQHFHI